MGNRNCSNMTVGSVFLPASKHTHPNRCAQKLVQRGFQQGPRRARARPAGKSAEKEGCRKRPSKSRPECPLIDGEPTLSPSRECPEGFCVCQASRAAAPDRIRIFPATANCLYRRANGFHSLEPQETPTRSLSISLYFMNCRPDLRGPTFLVDSSRRRAT